MSKELPPVEHSVWKALVMGRCSVETDFLTLRLMLQRCRVLAAMGGAGGDERIERLASELHALVRENRVHLGEEIDAIRACCDEGF